MYCIACGAKLAAGARFCTSCGAKVAAYANGDGTAQRPAEEVPAANEAAGDEPVGGTGATGGATVPTSANENPWNGASSPSGRGGNKVVVIAVAGALVLLVLLACALWGVFGGGSGEQAEQELASEDAASEAEEDDADAADEAAEDGDAAAAERVYALTVSGDDEQVAAVRAVVEERLDSFASDEAIRALVVDEFNELLESYTGYTAEELGLDVEEFASWYLDAFWYEFSSILVSDDGTAYVSFYHMWFDYTSGYDFAATVASYLDEERLFDGEELTEDQQAAVLELYDAFVNEAYDVDVDSISWFNLEQVDGAWTIIEDSEYEEEIAWIFDF